jgi:hypothetical protein
MAPGSKITDVWHVRLAFTEIERAADSMRLIRNGRRRCRERRGPKSGMEVSMGVESDSGTVLD